MEKRSFAPAGIESRSGVVSAEDVYVGEAGSGGLPPTDRFGGGEGLLHCVYECES